MEIELKYGCNPNQTFARVVCDSARPLEVLNGTPSYINVLDALRSWQLVQELKHATDLASAASFKHVSPAGAAVAGPLSEAFGRAFFVPHRDDLSPAATAYAKARSSDRVASFGDFVAVSETVDPSLADLIRPEVSDGIIAPAYAAEALETLRAKKKGNYVIMRMDPDYQPPDREYRLEFGLRLEQTRNVATIDARRFENIVTKNKEISDQCLQTLMVTTVTAKHTQSNTIVVGHQGQAVGIGAGQQSRIACTRLACDKFDRWYLKMHPKVGALRFKSKLPRSEQVNCVEQFVRYPELDGRERALLADALDGPVDPLGESERREWMGAGRDRVLSSDAFIPFRDNVDRAAGSGVGTIAQAGGSARDADVIAAADEHGMVMVLTGLRLFLH